MQVVDTVELFHFKRQRKLSLRFLAGYLLGVGIQKYTHDSIVDARTALQLFQVSLADSAWPCLLRWHPHALMHAACMHQSNLMHCWAWAFRRTRAMQSCKRAQLCSSSRSAILTQHDCLCNEGILRHSCMQHACTRPTWCTVACEFVTN